MSLVRTEAFVLKAIRFGETSVIYRLFTRDQGVVPVMARGVKRPKSRFGGVLEPFRRLQVTYYSRDNRDIQTLSGAELVTLYPAITESLERLEAGGRWFRLLRAVLPDGAPAVTMFDLVPVALERLCHTPVARMSRWETFHRAAAVAHLGVSPELTMCVACGRSVDGSETPSFSIVDGGVVCSGCRRERTGCRSLSPAEYALLNLYHHPEYELLEQLEENANGDAKVRDLVREFVRYHADLKPGAA
jgi:DNA repair protein RecO (recombination protein O)